ncbi:hypothetical protein QQP08_020356 [Theobroma cacao]|nr:hypothetical protein QQP08_020356 [Theobroma cacao]
MVVTMLEHEKLYSKILSNIGDNVKLQNIPNNLFFDGGMLDKQIDKQIEQQTCADCAWYISLNSTNIT